MARSNSFNKREVEKNKQQKRKEKRMKREARKNSAPRSFEEMIAYVDENGVVTDTPPDPNDKVEIELEDIEISVPQKEEVEEEELTGRVEFFDPSRGFGFIKDRKSVEKFFFHHSNAPENIEENMQVSFKLEQGRKGMNAIEIEIVK